MQTLSHKAATSLIGATILILALIAGAFFGHLTNPLGAAHADTPESHPQKCSVLCSGSGASIGGTVPGGTTTGSGGSGGTTGTTGR